MAREGTVEAQLEAGAAFADLSFWRKVEVSGSDAGAWLQDLVSADLSGMEAGDARRSLLLSPTGRIRAEFSIARVDGGWLLLQDPEQPRPIDASLAPYVLSSDVAVEDVTDALALLAVPGGREPIEAPGARVLAPTCLGGDGFDLIVPIDRYGALVARLGERLALAGNESVEGWRILSGIPRFGVDATEDDLPEEAGLDGAVAFDKGCYLGQEAVAKVRNLGHPRRLVMHLRADGAVSPGDRVFAGDEEAGQVTSAVASGNRTVMLARVSWGARGEPLRTEAGTPLAPAQASRPV
jgi:tRNA-modifying protein YgfZ